MSISTVNIPALSYTGTQQTGTFSTDAAGEQTATTSSDTVANAAVMNLVSSAIFAGGIDIMIVPGAGASGAAKPIQVTGWDLQAANQLTIPNPGIQTLVPAGTVVTRCNRIGIGARPKHVRITRQDTGDYYDWTEGMEPWSANATIGGSTSLVALAMLCQTGAIHIAPGILVASKTYSILVEY